MPIPPVTEFEGQLPNEGEPASFPARAEALFDWLVGQGMPTFNAAVAAINAALNDNGTVLDTAGKAIALTMNAGTLVPTGGTGNAYTITPAVAIPAYEDGQTFLLRTNRLNTGPVTLKVGALVAVPVEKLNADGTTFAELVAGDFRPGEVHLVGYRAGRFELLSTPLNRFVRTDAEVTITAPWTFSVAATFSNGLNGVIGGATPQFGTFSYAAVRNAGSAVFDIVATGVTDTHERTRLQRDGSGFSLQTGNAAGNVFTVDYFATVGANGVSAHSFRASGTERLVIDAAGAAVPTGRFSAPLGVFGDILPAVGLVDIGDALLGRFSTIFLLNSPNVSSDARLKEDIRDLSEAERRAAARIKTRTFVMRDTGQRKVGYIAQEVIEAMASEGLDAFVYGLVTDGETYGVDMDAINAFRLG